MRTLVYFPYKKLLILLVATTVIATAQTKAPSYKIGYELKGPPDPKTIVATISIGSKPLNQSEWTALGCSLRRDYLSNSAKKITILIFATRNAAQHYSGPLNDHPGTYKAAAQMRARFELREQDGAMILLNHKGKEGEDLSDGDVIPVTSQRCIIK